MPRAANGDLSFDHAIRALREGKFVLVHDVSSREDEIDMVVAAEFVTPDHIRRLREEAGGFVCQAITHSTAEILGLPYLPEIYRLAAKNYSILTELADGVAPYGDRTAFSITVNHRSTYTGITDHDRATTIDRLTKLCKIATVKDIAKARRLLASEFRSPGHVHILIAAAGLLATRRGHTELSLYLAELAGLIPATVICEILDGKTHNSLANNLAKKYAEENGIPFVEGTDLIASFEAKQLSGKSSKRNVQL